MYYIYMISFQVETGQDEQAASNVVKMDTYHVTVQKTVAEEVEVAAEGVAFVVVVGEIDEAEV